jgi:hypothetical protein
MGLTLVNGPNGQGSNAASGTTATYTVSATASALGTGLVLVVGWRIAVAASQTITGITDNMGNKWVPENTDNDATSTEKADIWTVFPATYIPGVTSIVVSFSIAASSDWTLYEISGGSTFGDWGDIGAGNHASSTAPTVSTGVLAQASQIAIAGIAWASNAATISGLTAGWTADTLQTGASPNQRLQPAHQIISSTAALTFAGTLSGSNRWAAVICTFKAAPTTGPYLVQGASAKFASVTAGATFSVSFPKATTAGNLLILLAGDWNTAAMPTLPGGWSTAWSDTDTTNADTIVLAYLANCAAGITSVTLTSTAAGTDEHDLIIAEFGGVVPSAPLDVAAPHVQNQTATQTPSVTAGSADAQAVELVLAGFIAQAANAVWTAGTGYAQVAAQAAAYFLEWKPVLAAGTQVAGVNNTLSQMWGGGIATFRGITPTPKAVITLQAVQRAAVW